MDESHPKCRKCNTALTVAEIQACKDRCVTCYTKAVRFVLNQKSRELDKANADLKAVNTRFEELLTDQKALLEVLEDLKKTA